METDDIGAAGASRVRSRARLRTAKRAEGAGGRGESGDAGRENARAVKDIEAVPCSWHRISSGFSSQGISSAVGSRSSRYLPFNCVWSCDIMGRTSPGSARCVIRKDAHPLRPASRRVASRRVACPPAQTRGLVRSVGEAQLLLHLNIGSDACAAAAAAAAEPVCLLSETHPRAKRGEEARLQVKPRNEKLTAVECRVAARNLRLFSRLV